MKSSILSIFFISVILLSSCQFLANAAGYVPQADLDAANAQVVDLNTQLSTANATIDELNTGNAVKDQQLVDLQAQFEKAQVKVDEVSRELSQGQNTIKDWQSLQCDQSWDFVWNEAMMTYPLLDYPSVPEYLQYYLSITQWSTDPNWELDNSKDFSVLILDRDNEASMIVDTVNDCVILNPDVFRFLDR